MRRHSHRKDGDARSVKSSLDHRTGTASLSARLSLSGRWSKSGAGPQRASYSLIVRVVKFGSDEIAPSWKGSGIQCFSE
jgi:hypothetical protein